MLTPGPAPRLRHASAVNLSHFLPVFAHLLTDPAGIQYSSAFQTDLQGHVGLSLRLSSPSDE
jgi:hypothetical protein